MSRIEIRPVELPRDAAKFVKAWWSIYEGDPHWVPPLIFERKQFLDPRRNPYHAHADIQLYMAFRDGKAVGTISAQVDHAYQEINPGVGFFGFFEFVNDVDIAQCLMRAACDWLREQGMTEAQGPFNFNTNHEFGCLIDGFDTDPCIANPHNREYYGAIYEQIGMAKEKDWYAYWMVRGDPPPQIERIAQRFMKRHPEITVRKGDLKHFAREVEIVYDIYEDAWSANWGHAQMSRAEFDFVAKGLRQVIDPNLFWIAEVDGEPAAMSLTLPDYNQVVKKMNGRLLPFGWWHWVFGRRRIDALRIWILGVKKQYQHMPLGAPLYYQIWMQGRDMPIRGAEASLVLEDNHRMRGALEKLQAHIYKTYRIWKKPLVEPQVRFDDATEAMPALREAGEDDATLPMKPLESGE